MKHLTKSEFVSPFDGNPVTRQVAANDGTMALEITARELTPIRARITDGLTTCVAFGLAASGFISFFQSAAPSVVYLIITGLGPLMAKPLFAWGIGKMLRKEIPMRLTTGEFAFQSGSKWKRFNRQIDHRFSLVAHDKTREEAEDNDFAVRKAQSRGRLIRKKRYYGESYHLSYDYLGQRNDIAVIYGRKEAMAVLSRLKACDSIMNMQAAKGAPINLKPQDEWGDQPGDVPERA